MLEGSLNKTFSSKLNLMKIQSGDNEISVEDEKERIQYLRKKFQLEEPSEIKFELMLNSTFKFNEHYQSNRQMPRDMEYDDISIRRIFRSMSYDDLLQQVRRIRASVQPSTYPIISNPKAIKIVKNKISPLPVSCLEKSLMSSSLPIKSTIDALANSIDLSSSDDALSLSSILTDKSFLSSFSSSPTLISPITDISQLSESSDAETEEDSFDENFQILDRPKNPSGEIKITQLNYIEDENIAEIHRRNSPIIPSNETKEDMEKEQITKNFSDNSQDSDSFGRIVCCGDICISANYQNTCKSVCARKIFSTKQDKTDKCNKTHSNIFLGTKRILPSLPTQISGIPLFRSNFRVTRRFLVKGASCLIALWNEVTFGVRAKDRRLIGILHRFQGSRAELVACAPVGQVSWTTAFFIYLRARTWDQMRWLVRDIDVCYPNWCLSRQLTH